MKITLLLSVLFILGSCSKGDSKPIYKFMPKSSDGIALKMGNITITEEEMNHGIESDIFEAEQKIYEIRFNKLKSMLMEKLMDSDPKKKGLSNDEYMDKYIASKIKISNQDVDTFVKERNIPQDQLTPDLKKRIEDFLVMEKKSGAVEDWLAAKSKTNPIEIFINKPRRPTFNVLVGDSPVLGNKDSKVTIVEFSDFQCPYCAKASTTVHEIKNKYGKDVSVVFKQYPLPFHKDARGAANAALCAHEQGADKFWKIHDIMFSNQSKLSISDLKAAGSQLGLNKESFEKCIDSNKFAAKIEENIKEGQELGVKSTPTFFVNGILLSGAQPLEAFSELIDEELAK